MIDKKPAVGRIILLESNLRDGHFGKMGHITKVANKRIYFVSPKKEEDDTEKEQQTYLFSAVCDTMEEAKMLQEFSWACYVEINKLRDKHAAAAKAFVVQE